MNKNWIVCIIASIVCRLLGLVAVLAFVYFMIVLTGRLHCLWLLFLILTLDYIPTYEFKHNTSNNEEDKGEK